VGTQFNLILKGTYIMATFAQAVELSNKKGHTKTENGMKTRKSSLSSVVDFFYGVGGNRANPENSLKLFTAALQEDVDLAIRVLLWSRDVRGGAGERNQFRIMLQYLAMNELELGKRVLTKIPELGRWDDILSLIGTPLEPEALEFISSALNAGNGLCAKWMPREKSAHKSTALKIMKYMGLKPTQYRKLLSQNTEVVEQLMCANEWSGINYSHVPSIAAKTYSKAFAKRDSERYQEYLTKLTKGDTDVKINAGAIFPHDVISSIWGSTTKSEEMRVQAQWDALPNYMEGGEYNILPLVDVSGSMGFKFDSKSDVTALRVAVSLGLYISTKNQGAFNGLICTFSETPKLHKISSKGIKRQLEEVKRLDWSMSTDIEAAFSEILEVATKNSVPQSEMPNVILILSDMQFDGCVYGEDSLSANSMIRKKYKKAGYEVPNIVFWNLKTSNGVPVKMDKLGTALVSGFSPSILKSVLTSIEDMTPIGVMMKTIMKDCYSI
jgi:hypothetical protein